MHFCCGPGIPQPHDSRSTINLPETLSCTGYCLEERKRGKQRERERERERERAGERERESPAEESFLSKDTPPPRAH